MDHFQPNYYLTQFISSHGNFNSYLKRFKIKESDICVCGKGLHEPMHLLFNCDTFLRERFYLENELELINVKLSRDSLFNLLNVKSAFSSFSLFVRKIF